ncbi:hypothetical protein DFP73DRAFT_558226, partial [Morchella snyderi]
MSRRMYVGRWVVVGVQCSAVQQQKQQAAVERASAVSVSYGMRCNQWQSGVTAAITTRRGQVRSDLCCMDVWMYGCIGGWQAEKRRLDALHESTGRNEIYVC